MSWILTHTGKHFDLMQPSAENVSPLDIAHALAHLCRFNGHTHRFYSVAQHSCMVADLVPAEHRLAALLHDATEAYIGDITRPFKALLPDARQIEQYIWHAICARFRLDPELPACVQDADMIALATEKRDLMPSDGTLWPCLSGTQPLAQRLRAWSSEEAFHQYQMQLFSELTAHNRRLAVQTQQPRQPASPAYLSEGRDCA